MKQRLANAVGCNPRWFIQFLEEVVVALLSRERALLPCEISLAFLNDGFKRIVFLPEECLNPEVQAISFGFVVFRRRVQLIARGDS